MALARELLLMLVTALTIGVAMKFVRSADHYVAADYSRRNRASFAHCRRSRWRASPLNVGMIAVTGGLTTVSLL